MAIGVLLCSKTIIYNSLIRFFQIRSHTKITSSSLSEFSYGKLPEILYMKKVIYANHNYDRG